MPECPRLAPRVELSGQLQDSGYQNQPWLVQRDGRFIQVTELLYRILELADGQRTLADIAQGLSERTPWIVSAEQVGQLIQSKLLPLALIESADGSTAQLETGVASPLQVNLRKNVVSPRVIDAIARSLQFLFVPPLVVVVLLAVAIAHAWLFLLHGMADSVRVALFTPGGLLLVMALAYLAAIAHEFGHAAALRYSGGRARGMGVGFFLLYPTFYTDTSDSYRLGRVARLRTDLGGIYFHLIFVLAIMSLYFLTAQEVLLAVVLLIDVDILYQCLPYLRLDGYWAVADLTGIPDLFSAIVPFARSLVPAAHASGDRLPGLKPWAKRVFALYILLTLPVIAVVFGLMLLNLPQFLVFAWSSLQAQFSALLLAQATGEILVMATAAAQVVFLALSLFAAVYMLLSTVRRALRAYRQWSRTSLMRRTAGFLAAAAIAALLALLWIPQFTFAGRPMPAGVEHFDVTERRHVETPVSYAQTPPVGGNHAGIWQNCGFYAQPIGSVYAVHSMEHGAVWITYQIDLAPEQVERLRQLAHREGYFIASPYPDLPQPVVASAWGYQLSISSVDDPRLQQFVRTFELGPQAPERQGPCTGGVGKPLP